MTVMFTFTQTTAEIAAARLHRPDRLHDFGPRGFLEHVAARARLHGAVNVFGARVHGEDDDLGGGTVLANLRGGFNAVQLGHGRVHQHHVGLERLRLAHGLKPVGGLAHDVEVALALEQKPQALAHHRVIIG